MRGIHVGLSSNRDPLPVEGKRFRSFGSDEALPAPRPGLWVDRQRRLAMLAGRCHNRPQAPLYRVGESLINEKPDSCALYRTSSLHLNSS